MIIVFRCRWPHRVFLIILGLGLSLSAHAGAGSASGHDGGKGGHPIRDRVLFGKLYAQKLFGDPACKAYFGASRCRRMYLKLQRSEIRWDESNAEMTASLNNKVQPVVARTDGGLQTPITIHINSASEISFTFLDGVLLMAHEAGHAVGLSDNLTTDAIIIKMLDQTKDASHHSLYEEIRLYSESFGNEQPKDQSKNGTMRTEELASGVGDTRFVMQVQVGGASELIPVTYRSETSVWRFNYAATGSAARLSEGSSSVIWGQRGDIPQVVRLGGTDHIAVFRPNTGQVILSLDNQSYSASNALVIDGWSPLLPPAVSAVVSNPDRFDGDWGGFRFGLPKDIPLLIQLSSGGPMLPVVFRPSIARWYVDLPGYSDFDPNSTKEVYFGAAGDVPEIVYWNGTEHFAVYRPATGQTIVNTDNRSYDGDNAAVLQW